MVLNSVPNLRQVFLADAFFIQIVTATPSSMRDLLCLWIQGGFAFQEPATLAQAAF